MRRVGRLPRTWRTRSPQACAAVAVAGPLFVLAVGKDSDAPIRLRLVGLVLAALVALGWEDRMAPLVTATPVGLPAVQRRRLGCTVLTAAAAWAASCWAASTQVPHVGGWWATVEVAAVTAVLTAVVGALARDRPGESLSAYPVPVLLVLLVLAFRLPQRWALVAAPGTAQWTAAHQRWGALLVLGLVGVAVASRDPATRGHALPRSRNRNRTVLPSPSTAPAPAPAPAPARDSGSGSAIARSPAS